MEIFSTCAASGSSVDASKAFMFLGFDLVSELTFGESFNMLSTGKPNGLTAEFEQGKKFVGFAMLSMWLFYLVKAFPGVDAHIQHWERWYERAIDKRREVCFVVISRRIDQLIECR